MTDPSLDHVLHRRAIAGAVLVTLLWSSSYVLIRIGLDDESLPPLTFAGLRYGVAAALLWPWMRWKVVRSRRTGFSRVELSQLLLLGVGFYAITQGAQFVAIDNQPAATTSVVLSLTPMAVGIAGFAAIGERSSARQFAGTVLVIAGAVLYFAGDLGATVVGMTAAVVGLAANTASSLFGRHVNRRTDRPAVVITTVSMSTGAVVLLIAGIAVEGWPDLSATSLALIAWLAVVNTALAFTIWNHSLRHLAAIESAGINNLMLIQIAGLAWIFLGEAPGLPGVLGVVTVSIGVFLTQTARRRETAPRPEG